MPNNWIIIEFLLRNWGKSQLSSKRWLEINMGAYSINSKQSSTSLLSCIYILKIHCVRFWGRLLAENNVELLVTVHFCVFIRLDWVLYIYIVCRSSCMKPPCCASILAQNGQSFKNGAWQKKECKYLKIHYRHQTASVCSNTILERDV